MDIANLERLCTENPASPLFARLADAYLAEGRKEEARHILEVGLERYPTYVTGSMVYAKYLLSVNQFVEAQNFLLHVSAFSADYPGLRALLEQCQIGLKSQLNDEQGGAAPMTAVAPADEMIVDLPVTPPAPATSLHTAESLAELSPEEILAHYETSVAGQQQSAQPEPVAELVPEPVAELVQPPVPEPVFEASAAPVETQSSPDPVLDAFGESVSAPTLDAFGESPATQPEPEIEWPPKGGVVEQEPIAAIEPPQPEPEIEWPPKGGVVDQEPIAAFEPPQPEPEIEWPPKGGVVEQEPIAAIEPPQPEPEIEWPPKGGIVEQEPLTESTSSSNPQSEILPAPISGEGSNPQFEHEWPPKGGVVEQEPLAESTSSSNPQSEIRNPQFEQEWPPKGGVVEQEPLTESTGSSNPQSEIRNPQFEEEWPSLPTGDPLSDAAEVAQPVVGRDFTVEDAFGVEEPAPIAEPPTPEVIAPAPLEADAASSSNPQSEIRNPQSEDAFGLEEPVANVVAPEPLVVDATSSFNQKSEITNQKSDEPPPVAKPAIQTSTDNLQVHAGRIVSKTLAEIYTAQGVFEEALVTYQLLKQQRPEENAIWDARIADLQKKIKDRDAAKG